MEQRELLMNFMRSLKAKGLLDKDIHGSVVDVFIHSELPRLATTGGSADVRCRFDSGDQVMVKFRKLDRFWNGMVHKDDGGKYVEVIKNGLHWEITKVERDRIKIAS
jgi:hypothetical protein